MGLVVVTPAFCKAALLRDCLENIYRAAVWRPITGARHLIIDNHYPINQAANSQEIREIASAYHCEYIDSGKDLGLHEGLNNAMRVAGVTEKDVVIGCDPDDRPMYSSFLPMYRVMEEDPTITVLGLNFWVIRERKKQDIPFTVKNVGPYEVWYHPAVEMWNVAAFRMSQILPHGGFSQCYEYYGGLESSMSTIPNFKLAYMANWHSEGKVDREDRTRFDPEYRQWKTDHVKRIFKGSFKEWLVQKQLEEKPEG